MCKSSQSCRELAQGTEEGQDHIAEESAHDGNIDEGISTDMDLSVFVCVKCDHMSIGERDGLTLDKCAAQNKSLATLVPPDLRCVQMGTKNSFVQKLFKNSVLNDAASNTLVSLLVRVKSNFIYIELFIIKCNPKCFTG